MGWLLQRISFGLIKDAVGFTISIAAFAISIYSLYANSRNVDQLGVIVADNIPLIDIHKDGEFAIARPSAIATFVNSGTRYAAVVGAKFSVEQPDDLTWRACDHSTSKVMRFSFEPFVIKPKEIVAKYMQLAADEPKSIPIKNRAAPSAILCLEFDVTTPDGLTLNITRPVLAGRWPEKDGTRNFVPMAWLPGKTIELIGK